MEYSKDIKVNSYSQAFEILLRKHINEDSRMIVLGIANNDYAGACLIIDGQIIAAASEERFTRVKAHKVFPFNAIEFVLSEANLKLTDIDKFAYGWSAGNRYLGNRL